MPAAFPTGDDDTARPDQAGDPSGFGQRRRRLSDEETARRMLQAATDTLTRSGLTVSLEHLRLEDVIRDAGVSRSTVYRRWPHKDEFLGDLLVELARTNARASATSGRATTEAVRRTVLDHLDWLESPDGRERLTFELLRETAWQDFQESYGSAKWRTYLALTVTLTSLPHGRLREQVQQALTSSEESFTAQVARSYQVLAELLGLRLRPQLQASYETLARLGNAEMRGLVIQAFASPETVDERVHGEVFGSSGEWSLPALGLIGVVTTYLEPDPEVEWDRARTASLRERLETTEDLFADPWSP